MNLIQSLDVQKRGTVRKLANGIKCSKGLIRAHTSAIKPNLIALNKLLILMFSLEQLESDCILNMMNFKTKHKTIYIDENGSTS